MLRGKFFPILLDPDNQGGGDPPAGSVDDKPTTPAADDKLKELESSVQKLTQALESERELKREADRKAAEARQAAEDATKTVEQKLEERLNTLESENRNLKLEQIKAKAIRDELKALDKDGYEVNEEALTSLMKVTRYDLDNVDTVVKTIIGSIKKVKTAGVSNNNSQPPAAGAKPKLDYSNLPQGSLTGSPKT